MNKLIVIYIKILRGNFFISISNNSGKLLWNKTAGNVGFSNIKKRDKEALKALLNAGTQYLTNLEKIDQILIKMEGVKKMFFEQINTYFITSLKQSKIKIFGIKLINKIAHNGCKKPLSIK